MISISVITRHENDCGVITALLAGQNDFRIASVGKDGYDAIRSAMVHRPDIILMDFQIGDIDGPELAPMIRRYSPSTGFIVLRSPEKKRELGRAIKAGISGYLSKDDGFDNVASSVRCVFHGGYYFCNCEKARVLQFINMLDRPKPEKPETQELNPGLLPRHCNEIKKILSPTELYIFSGIALGFKDDEIAGQLNITTGALRNNVNNVKHKTGLRNRSQIIAYAMYHGIINCEKIWEQFKQ